MRLKKVRKTKVYRPTKTAKFVQVKRLAGLVFCTFNLYATKNLYPAKISYSLRTMSTKHKSPRIKSEKKIDECKNFYSVRTKKL